MTQERISAKEYQALTAKSGKHQLREPEPVSRLVEPKEREERSNPYAGMSCRVCGERVKQSEPATSHTDIDADGNVSGRWVQHLECGAALL